MASVDLQLRKGVLEIAVLAQLDRCPTYGGDLLETLGKASALEISQGTLYPLLSRLNKAKLVATTWKESPVGPPRKYYELTKKGRTHLNELTQSWRQLTAAVEDILEGNDD
jgi:Predicted transcriptional regulators